MTRVVPFGVVALTGGWALSGCDFPNAANFLCAVPRRSAKVDFPPTSILTSTCEGEENAHDLKGAFCEQHRLFEVHIVAENQSERRANVVFPRRAQKLPIRAVRELDSSADEVSVRINTLFERDGE
jgi:hypothetical protein